MNTYYQYPIKNEETGKYGDDYMIIVYKDNQTGKKFHEIISKPEYTFYMAKPGVQLDHNLLFIDKDKVEPITTLYTKLEKTIAEKTDNIEFFKQNIMEGNRADNRKLHTLPNVFASDMNVEDYYRWQFSKKFSNNISKLKKGYFDIEVDGRYSSGDFVKMGECPINAVSYYDESSNTITQFLLRNPKNPLIANYEAEISNGRFTIEDIHKALTQYVGGWKQAIRFHIDKVNINFKFFDQEIELLISLFQTIHESDPDFCMGWNSSNFDIAYIIARIYQLGYEPADIMSDSTWDLKIVKNYVDIRNLSNLAERGDYTFISGNTVFIDQMIQYASRRKSKIGSFKSFKLDDIGEFVAEIHKLNYSNITHDITMLPYLNYKIFSLYNLMDVIVQKCIEQKTQDMEYIFAKCIVNNTSYRKGHRQTVYLINRMAKEWDKMGYIIGNNKNKWNPKPDKFAGAMVGDPDKVNDYSKVKVNGIPIMVIDNLQDNDYKSLYPSIDIENNIAPNTQVGKINIPEQVYDHENFYLNDKYERGGEFIENMVTDNPVEFCHRWFHLAGVMEFLEDMLEYQKKYYKSYNSIGTYDSSYYKDGRMIIVPLRDICDRNFITDHNNYSSISIQAVKELDAIKPIYFINKHGDKINDTNV